MSSEHCAYGELQAYTLTRADPEFIHQHVVDAWAAQHANADTKPIGIVFALVGLYLHCEHGLTGREVQRAHMMLARRGKGWRPFPLPATRGAMSAVDVMAAPAGPERDHAIEAWCADVWAAYRESHDAVADLVRQYGVA